jgi:DHA2 family multidrug resistance protein-like MFS transporter
MVIVGSVPLGNVSSAASVSETGGQLGYALAIALLDTLVDVVYRANLHVEAGLDRDQRAAIMESLAGSRHIIPQLPPDVALRVQAAAAEAFCSGIQVVAMSAAATTAALGVVCLLRFITSRSSQDRSVERRRRARLGR